MVNSNDYGSLRLEFIYSYFENILNTFPLQLIYVIVFQVKEAKSNEVFRPGD